MTNKLKYKTAAMNIDAFNTRILVTYCFQYNFIMHNFERKLLDSVKASKEAIEDYVESNKGNVIEVKPGEHFPFQFGPIISTDAQMELYEGVFNTCKAKLPVEKLGEDDLPSIFTSFSNAKSMATLEMNVSDKYVPTAIKNAIGDVLNVDDNEATRIFNMGPDGSTLPIQDDFDNMFD